MFIGRKEELKELERIYNAGGFHMLLIYGKPGAGKTTLLEEFCRDKDTIFFTAANKSSRSNLTNFSSKVLEHFGDEMVQPFSFWENAFLYIRDKDIGAKIIIVIDEFTEIAKRDMAFMNVLFSSVDKQLQDSNIILIIASDDEKFTNKFPLLQKEMFADKTHEMIHLENFLNDETIKILTEEAMKRSKGIERSKFIRVSADEIIQCEGEITSDMYRIVSGKAICYLNYGTENEYVIGSFKEGACFGEYQLLTGKPALCTMVAYSDMLLLRISRDEFSKFIEMNAANAIDIMHVQAKMINAMKVHLDMLIDELKS